MDKITHCCLTLRQACFCRMLVGKQEELEAQSLGPRYPPAHLLPSPQDLDNLTGSVDHVTGDSHKDRTHKDVQLGNNPRFNDIG